MKLSIVTTLYKSAPYIQEFYERISAEAKGLTDSYEIVFVNDGSPDNSIDLAVKLYESDEHVKVVDLSRNFGHHKAMMTGLRHASGEYVFLIDSDLEEEPELLSKFWDEFSSSGHVDMVYGVQGSRKGGAFERLSGNLFYKLFNFLSETKIPKNFLTVRLMTRRFVEALCSHEERELNFSTLVQLTGFNSIELQVKKGHKRESGYTLAKRFSILINAVTSSTARPLWIIFYFGLTVTLLSTTYIGYLIYVRLAHGVSMEGWTSLIVSVWFFGGLTILFLGIIGIYLSKVFSEVKARPFTVIKNIYER